MVNWHFHTCPQCEKAWECGCDKPDDHKDRWCPHGPLCHIPWPNDGTFVKPKRIRPNRGVGPMFEAL